MSTGEFDTPGPFTRSDSAEPGLIWWGSRWAARMTANLDEAEREELVGLLNKGTHFKGLLEVLKEVAEFTNAPATVHAAIAKAEPGA